MIERLFPPREGKRGTLKPKLKSKHRLPPRAPTSSAQFMVGVNECTAPHLTGVLHTYSFSLACLVISDPRYVYVRMNVKHQQHSLQNPRTNNDDNAYVVLLHVVANYEQITSIQAAALCLT